MRKLDTPLSSNRQGDIVHLNILGQPVIVLGSLDVITEFLEKRSNTTSDRQQTAMIELWVFLVYSYCWPCGCQWGRERDVNRCLGLAPAPISALCHMVSGGGIIGSSFGDISIGTQLFHTVIHSVR